MKHKGPKWIEWNGQGKAPAFYEHDLVEVKYRDGTVPPSDYEPWMFSGWWHRDRADDIVAYRVVNKR